MAYLLSYWGHLHQQQFPGLAQGGVFTLDHPGTEVSSAGLDSVVTLSGP